MMQRYEYVTKKFHTFKQEVDDGETGRTRFEHRSAYDSFAKDLEEMAKDGFRLASSFPTGDGILAVYERELELKHVITVPPIEPEKLAELTKVINTNPILSVEKEDANERRVVHDDEGAKAPQGGRTDGKRDRKARGQGGSGGKQQPPAAGTPDDQRDAD